LRLSLVKKANSCPICRRKTTTSQCCPDRNITFQERCHLGTENPIWHCRVFLYLIQSITVAGCIV
uniref:RING-type domain-containing protein n=1 Tax=Toxocara canis TaxID=6265 RepID=A0A183U7Z9_TOXCA